MSRYDDIINLDRPISKHNKMTIEMRAAQFAPFAALTGYSEAIKEEGRLTDSKKELVDGVVDEINDKLNELKDNLNKEVVVTYFIKDKFKCGGKYVTKVVKVKKIDYYNHTLKCMEENILFEDILEINFKQKVN